MRIVTSSSSKSVLRITKSEWEAIGRMNKWAGPWTSKERLDVLPPDSLFRQSAPLQERITEIMKKWHGRGGVDPEGLLKHLATSQIPPGKEDDEERAQARADWAEITGLRKKIEAIHSGSKAV